MSVNRSNIYVILCILTGDKENVVFISLNLLLFACIWCKMIIQAVTIAVSQLQLNIKYNVVTDLL